MTKPIGVLALQGAFAKHAEALEALGHDVVLVRAAGDLSKLGGLVLPGGESTVQRKLLQRLGIELPLVDLVHSGVPVLATCAGLILSAQGVGAEGLGFGFLDVDVDRNAWGPQLDSFESKSDEGRALVFIRAPRIVRVGDGVRVRDRFQGEPILVQQGNVTGATFHPELTTSLELHREVFGSKRAFEREGRAHEVFA